MANAQKKSSHAGQDANQQVVMILIGNWYDAGRGGSLRQVRKAKSLSQNCFQINKNLI